MAAQLTAQPIDLDASVRSKFTVKDSFQLPDGEMEFSVVYRPDSKERFVELCRELAVYGFTPKLVGSEEDALLFVRKAQTAGKQRSGIFSSSPFSRWGRSLPSGCS